MLYQAIKLAASNLHVVRELAPMCADLYLQEYEMNTEEGITTYLTKQDFFGAQGGACNVYTISDEYGQFSEAFENAADIDETEFKDVYPKKR